MEELLIARKDGANAFGYSFVERITGCRFAFCCFHKSDDM
jgi:hypothetical protein